MNITARSYFNPDNLCTIEDVLSSLEFLGHDLPLAKLERLDAFNQTYLVITRNVRQELRKGSFDFPDFLEKFDTRFAYYYLRALQGYLMDEKIPKAWQIAFDAAASGRVRPMICMALGVNAHVNNDIPQVLRDCQADQRQYRDYKKVNKIIRSSLDEIIDLFKQPERLLDPDKKNMRPLFRFGMHSLVKIWRFTAWRRFERLIHKNDGVIVIEHKAEQTGQGISRLPI